MTDTTDTETDTETDSTTGDDYQALAEAAAAPDAPWNTDRQDTADPGSDRDEQDAGSNGEAAKYRRKLRETETERDQATAQLDVLRRAEVERVAAGTLKTPSALWAAGIEVADLLAADGTVDRDKVHAASVDAAERLGLARPVGPNHVPSEGAIPDAPRGDPWASAFRPG